jgi:hypothetical protein
MACNQRVVGSSPATPAGCFDAKCAFARRSNNRGSRGNASKRLGACPLDFGVMISTDTVYIAGRTNTAGGGFGVDGPRQHACLEISRPSPSAVVLFHLRAELPVSHGSRSGGWHRVWRNCADSRRTDQQHGVVFTTIAAQG